MNTYLIEIEDGLGCELIQAKSKNEAIGLARDWIMDGTWDRNLTIWYSVGEVVHLNRKESEYYCYVGGIKISKPVNLTWHQVDVFPNA